MKLVQNHKVKFKSFFYFCISFHYNRYVQQNGECDFPTIREVVKKAKYLPIIISFFPPFILILFSVS